MMVILEVTQRKICLGSLNILNIPGYLLGICEHNWTPMNHWTLGSATAQWLMAGWRCWTWLKRWCCRSSEKVPSPPESLAYFRFRVANMMRVVQNLLVPGPSQLISSRFRGANLLQIVALTFGWCREILRYWDLGQCVRTKHPADRADNASLIGPIHEIKYLMHFRIFSHVPLAG